MNDNDFLSEPEDEFHLRQTDFDSVMKNNDACDEYIQIIKLLNKEINKLVIYTHVISRHRNILFTLLNTYVFLDWQRRRHCNNCYSLCVIIVILYG